MKDLLAIISYELNGRKTLISLALGAVYLLALTTGITERNEALEATVLTGLTVGLSHKAIKG